MRRENQRGSYRHSNPTTRVRLLEPLESRLLLSAIYPDLRNVLGPTDNPTLLTGMDVYTPPVNTQTPGSSAPGLAELTRTGKADDALALTGYQLSSYAGADLGKDTQFTFWSQTTSGNGVLANGSILRLDSLEAAVTVPASALNNSMYLVWAQNNSGVSYPLAINKTEAWWTSSSDHANRGQTLSVYGRNLSYYDSTYTGTNPSWIYIRPTSGGAGQWVTPTAVNPYKVDFTVPATLANGTYEVWVHNGHGGKYGWSRSTNITVDNAVVWNGTIRNVKTYGAKGDGSTNDTATVQAAINASAAGDKIYFPAGNYVFGPTAAITIPANRQVYGDGMASSTINTALVFGSQCKVNDLAITVSLNTPTRAGGAQFWANNVSFSETNSTGNFNTLDLSGTNYAYITNCKSTGGMFWLGAQWDIYLDHVDFYARFDVEDVISSWGSQRVSVTNCTCQHYNTSDPTNNSGWGEGRFFVNTCIWNAANNCYLAGNTTNQFVVRSGGDQNSGEQIMSEGVYTYFEGGVTASTSTSVTINDPSGSASLSICPSIVVVAGKGLGQVRQATSWNAATKTVTIDTPWNVLLDSTSVIEAVREPMHYAVYNNSLSGTVAAATQTAHVANMGVDMFTGGTDLIVDKNTFTNMRYGVHWDASMSMGDFGNRTAWNYTYNNTFNNVRWPMMTVADSGATGATALGHLWRANTVTSVPAGGAAISETGATNVNAVQLDIYDKNQISNAAIGYSMDTGVTPLDTIFYKNTFNRGTATLSGSVGLQFGLVNPDIAGKGAAGNGWAGAWQGPSSDAGNQHPKFIVGQNLSYSATGYSNVGNNLGEPDGSIGQTNTWMDSFVSGYSDRYFTTPMTGTIWVSALVSRAEATWTVLGFNADPLLYPGGRAKTFLGLSNTSNQAWLQYNAPDLYLGHGATVNAPLNTTHLMLVKIQMNVDSNGNDTVSYWFDPNLAGGEAGLGTPTLFNSGGDAIGASLQGISVNVERSGGATASNLIDSLRISNDANGFTAVTTGSGGALVADYFNNYWGPVTTAPAAWGNTVSNYETAFGGVVPKPGNVLELPTRGQQVSLATGSSTTLPLTIWNAGFASMSWTATSDASWLTLSAASGTLADQNAASSLTLTCNAASMAPGTYIGTVTVATAAGNQSKKAQVVLTVLYAGDFPTVTLAPTDPNASETGPNTGTFTITRTGSSGDLVVNYTIGGSATNTTDYAPLSSSVLIPNGQTSAIITVTPIDDALSENDETVVLTLTSNANYLIGTPNTATVTILDNDPPAVTLVATTPNAAEQGPISGGFTVTRTGRTQGAITVNYTIGGSATNTADYATLSGSVVIPDGVASATITVAPVDDTLIEGSETVLLTLASGSGYTLGSPSNATVTLLDNDSPSSWTDQDIGAVGVAGSYTANAGIYTVKGSGAVIWGTSDQCNFLWQQMTGDGTVTARVTSVQNVAADTLAGVMFRETLTPGSTEAFMAHGPTVMSAFDRRLTTNGNTDHDTPGGTSIPYWVRLVRAGNTFSAYQSPDGTTWPQVGATQTIPMASTIYVGLAVVSGNNAQLCTATFDNVTIPGGNTPMVTLAATTPNANETGPVNGVFTVTRSNTAGNLVVNYSLAGTATNTADYTTLPGSVVIPNGQTSATITVAPVDDALPEGTETVLLTLTSNSTYLLGTPSSATVSIADKLSTGGTWTDLDLGGPGAAGSVSFNSATQAFTVSGAGADIGSTTDSFNYFYQPLQGDGTIIARVPSIQNTHSAAKAGIMIRNTLDATSAQAMVAVTPDNAVSFLTRTTLGGSTTSSSASIRGTPPYWLKLVRSGNTLTAYASSNPTFVDWTQVGSPTTIAMNQTVYIGLAVTSHVAGTLCAATFDHLALTVNQLPATGVTLNVGTLQLAPATTPNTLSQIPSLILTGGTLDLTNNDLLVTNGATQEQAVSTHLLPAPAADGTTTPITTTGVLTGTAYTALYGASFHGQPLTANALVLQYTRAGDSDLSGQISSDDYLATDAGYLFGRSANATWATGDFNHDGQVTAADYALLDQNFRAAGAPAAGALIQLHTAWFGPTYLTPAPAPVTPTVPTTPTVPSHPLPPTPLPTAPLNNPVWWTFPSTHPTLQARLTLSDDLTLDLLSHPATPRSLLPARSRLSLPFVPVQGPTISGHHLFIQ